MDWIDILAPRVDGHVDEGSLGFADLAETTDVAIDVVVDLDEDDWLGRLLDESGHRLQLGEKKEALELLGVALRIDRRNDLVRARYFALAAELTARRERGDETLQILADELNAGGTGTTEPQVPCARCAARWTGTSTGASSSFGGARTRSTFDGGSATASVSSRRSIRAGSCSTRPQASATTP